MQEMKETWIESLDWKDHLEEGMATHSCILASKIPWTKKKLKKKKIPWTEEPAGLQFRESQRAGHS